MPKHGPGCSYALSSALRKPKYHNITNTNPDDPVQSPDVAVCEYSLCKHT